MILPRKGRKKPSFDEIRERHMLAAEARKLVEALGGVCAATRLTNKSLPSALTRPWEFRASWWREMIAALEAALEE